MAGEDGGGRLVEGYGLQGGDIGRSHGGVIGRPDDRGQHDHDGEHHAENDEALEQQVVGFLGDTRLVFV